MFLQSRARLHRFVCPTPHSASTPRGPPGHVTPRPRRSCWEVARTRRARLPQARALAPAPPLRCAKSSVAAPRLVQPAGGGTFTNCPAICILRRCFWHVWGWLGATLLSTNHQRRPGNWPPPSSTPDGQKPRPFRLPLGPSHPRLKCPRATPGTGGAQGLRLQLFALWSGPEKKENGEHFKISPKSTALNRIAIFSCFSF